MTRRSDLQPRDDAATYAMLARLIEHVDAHFREQPSLTELAAVAGISPFHFQRLFRRWAGLSPTRFVAALTAAYARQRLAASASVLEAAFEAGLSGPGRLHDLMVQFEAATPGQVRRQGEAMTLTWGMGDSVFGRCLLATTPRGLCRLAFVDARAEAAAEAMAGQLQRDWPRATLVRDDAAVRPALEAINHGADRPPLHVRGRNLQVQVWRALLALPAGALVSYGDLARHVGRPTAARAVAAAVGSNPVAYFIPCHRVIARTGAMQGYRWGVQRKRIMIASEAAAA